MADRARLVRAETTQKQAVARLIQLYLYDLSAVLQYPIEDDGRYQYSLLDEFWQYPYLIYKGEELAGFALVIDRCPITDTADCFFIAELFVLRRHREQGIAAQVCADAFRLHRGHWHVGVILRNKQAIAFWKRVLSGRDHLRTSERQHDGERWRVFEFVT